MLLRGPARPVAEPLDGPWATRVREMAAGAGLVVVAGMFTPDGDRVRNTLIATGPGVNASYDKIHLFDAFGFQESATVAPGDACVRVEVDGVTVGLTTCYDIRFPALFQDLAADGAQVIVVAASWGQDRASGSSGSCWPAPARWTRPRTCSPAGRPTRRRSVARSGRRRPGSATASW